MKKERFIASVLASAVCFSSAVLPFGQASVSSLASITAAAEEDAADPEGSETSDVISYLLGDVNGDGAVNALDASIILSEYASSSTGKGHVLSEPQLIAADVDKNNTVDSSDASVILKYYSYNSTGGKLDLEGFLKEPPVTTAPVTTEKETTTTTAAATEETGGETTTATKPATSKPTATTTKSGTAKPTATTTKSGTDKPTATTTKSGTAKPTTTTTKSATAKPTATTTKSGTAKPTTTITKPTTAKPTTTTTKPTTAKPTTTTTKPTTAKPVTTTTKPAAEDHVKVSEIRITRTKAVINVNESDWAAIVTMLPSEAPDKGEIWSSSDENIAVVDDQGWVTGINEGVCIITVTSSDNPEISAEIELTVVDNAHVKSIRLSRTTMTLQAGYGDLAALVTMLPTTALNKEEEWISSDSAIAEVDDQGWVTAKKAGNAVITVKSKDNPAAFAFVLLTVVDGYTPAQTTAAVTEPSAPTTTVAAGVSVSEITVSDAELDLSVGEQKTPTVKLYPENASNKSVNWKSSNESVAKVDAGGKITAVGAGNCIITVNSSENASVKANIIVNVKTSGEVTNITLSKYSMEVPVGTSDISLVTMYPSTAKNQEEIWTTSDPSVATVDKYGWVYGVSEGECIVTVFSEDTPTVKAEIKVKITKSGASSPVIQDFSSIVPGKSTATQIAFMTPFPEQADGQYFIRYFITDANGKKSYIDSSSFKAPDVRSVTTMLTAATNEFSAEAYLINTTTADRAMIGRYTFALNPRDARTETEDITTAFRLLGGLN